MATRLYLSAGIAGYIPPTIQGSFPSSSSPVSRALGAKSGSADTNVVSGVTGTVDALHGVWISAPFLSAGSLAGTVTWCAGLLESLITNDAFLKVHIYVTQGDTDTPRGTLLNNFVSSTEYPAPVAGQSDGAHTLSSVSCQVGDRIVAEFGVHATNLSSSRSATMHLGNTGGTDLSNGSTSVTTQPGWAEFSGADPLFVAATAKFIPPILTPQGTFH